MLLEKLLEEEEEAMVASTPGLEQPCRADTLCLSLSDGPGSKRKDDSGRVHGIRRAAEVVA